jgi:hypothetical protein
LFWGLVGRYNGVSSRIWLQRRPIMQGTLAIPLEHENSLYIPEVVGVTGSLATEAALVNMTQSLTYPASNLGFYIVAEKLASAVGVGGPVVPKAIVAVGGPILSMIIIAIAVGLVCYGVAKFLQAVFRCFRRA